MRARCPSEPMGCRLGFAAGAGGMSSPSEPGGIASLPMQHGGINWCGKGRPGLPQTSLGLWIRRLENPGGGEGEDFHAVLGDADHVFELRGKAAVACDGGPAIVQY